MEENYFWFRVRNELVIWALQQYMFELKSFMEEVKKGPALSVITNAVASEVPEDKKYNSFEIKF